MTRTSTTRRPPHAVAAIAAAALGEGTVWAIGGFSGDGEAAPLCVRSALGA